jgi:hypothetical protein
VRTEAAGRSLLRRMGVSVGRTEGGWRWGEGCRLVRGDDAVAGKREDGGSAWLWVAMVKFQ